MTILNLFQKKIVRIVAMAVITVITLGLTVFFAIQDNKSSPPSKSISNNSKASSSQNGGNTSDTVNDPQDNIDTNISNNPVDSGYPNSNEVDNNNKTPTIKNPNLITLASFETIKELQTISYKNNFGKISLNSEPKYITNGKNSMRAEILGNVYEGKTFYPTMEFIVDNDYINKKDFSDIIAVYIDIYNASDRDITTYFYFNSLSKEKGGAGNKYPYLLKKGHWNHLKLFFNREAIKEYYDMSNIGSFALMFENGKGGQSAPILFIDNFRAERTDAAIKDSFEVPRTTDELFFFENAVQAYAGYPLGEYRVEGNPSVCINRDLRYVSQGKQSLRIVAPQCSVGGWGSNGYPYVRFAGQFMSDVKDFTKYNGMSFDIFNNCNRDQQIYLYIKDKNGKSYMQGFVTKPDRWVTVNVDFKDILVEGFDLTNIVEINICWEGNSSYTRDMVLYLDNMSFTS